MLAFMLQSYLDKVTVTRSRRQAGQRMLPPEHAHMYTDREICDEHAQHTASCPLCCSESWTLRCDKIVMVVSQTNIISNMLPELCE